MDILIYGDSNTYGQIPNLDGYSKHAKLYRYDIKYIWWYHLSKKYNIVVDALPGRGICVDNPWLDGRNASKTILEDLTNKHPDLTIIQLGTNDCKSRYGLSANEIVKQLEKLINTIKTKTNSSIMLISPALIHEGNKITDKYYKGAEQKTKELDKLYKKLCEKNGFAFVSGLDLSVGEDGEHFTLIAHKSLGEKVELALNNNLIKER